MRSIAGGIDGLEAVFDDASLVADAGLLLAGTLMQRLGLEALLDATVRPSRLPDDPHSTGPELRVVLASCV